MKDERARQVLYSPKLLSALPGAAAWPVAEDAILMQSHAWTLARMALASTTHPQHLFSVGNAQGIAAIAPMIAIGDWLKEPPLMYEPSDLIWSTLESLDALALTLVNQPNPIYFERMPVESPTLEALRRAYRGKGVVVVRPAISTPYICIEDRSSDVNTWLNAGRRSDLRRSEKRAATFGTVSYEILTPTSVNELSIFLEEAYAVEAKSWKGSAGTALATNNVYGNFYSSFSKEAFCGGMLRFAFMRINGEAVAMQIACHWQQRYWLCKIGYDPAFKHCSPGQLLILHTLRHAASVGLRSYEFLGFMEDWMMLWTKEAHHYQQVRAIPFTTKSLAMAVRSSPRLGVKLLKRLLRQADV